MKGVLKVTFAYLAAVIGAGFASGSEILVYFVRYGKNSIIGIVVASILFGLIIYYLLSACVQNKITSFDLLSKTFLDKTTDKFTGVVMIIFMIIMLGAMISGFAEMTWSVLGIKRSVSSLLFTIACAFILCMPEEKIIKWGGYAGLFIVAFICICSIYMINFRAVKVFATSIPAVASSFVYTAYNALAVCPVICSAAADIKTKMECKEVGVLSGIFSFCALFLIWSLLMIYYGKIELGQLPMITLASRQGVWLRNIYAVTIIVAVLSSAVANAYGLCLKFSSLFKSKRNTLLFVLLSGWIVASVSFINIVDKLYRYVGIISIIILINLILKIKKNSDNRNITKENEENRT